MHKLTTLPNGQYAVHSTAYRETMHPGLGPRAEAEFIHIGQLKLAERSPLNADFVVWDIGLGAGANAIAMLQNGVAPGHRLQVVSFDESTDGLAFALENAAKLDYLLGYEPLVRTLLENHRAEIGIATWTLHVGDFSRLLESREVESIPKPAAILFDPFSPAKNSAMWTLTVFRRLFSLLDPTIPCALTTYSRSTMVRVTMLLAGFFVGRGRASGLKEETTVASNDLTLLDEPLGKEWLDRVQKSHNAEPLSGNTYTQAPLSAEKWEQLRAHPQFSK